MIDPFSTEYVLGVAFGLGGAAVYHLFWPVLRILWAVVKFPAFIIYDLVDNDHSSSENWRVFYRKEPTELHPVHGWIETKCGLLEARHNTRIAALEERMDAVENPKRSHATACDDYYAATRVSYTPSLYSGGASGYFASGIDRNATGRPCPKPTKDLRPGDEVSMKLRICGLRTSRLYNNRGESEPVVDMEHPTIPDCNMATVTIDKLDALRTDNK